MASLTPSSEEILGISRTIPEVEIVILDLPTRKPIGSVNIPTALDTFHGCTEVHLGP